MANYSGAASQHQTLTANTVDRVILDRDYETVEVLHRGTSGEIYFTVDQQGAGTDPTAGAAGTYVVTAGSALRVGVPNSTTTTEVRLISSAGVAYSVTGIV